jgi:hypothetical protein
MKCYIEQMKPGYMQDEEPGRDGSQLEHTLVNSMDAGLP